MDVIDLLINTGYSVSKYNDIPYILEVFGNGFNGFLFCLESGYAALVSYEVYPFYDSDPLVALHYASEGYFGVLQKE